MLVLVRCFSYAPHASLNPDDTFNKVFLLVTLLILVLVRSVSCTPDANLMSSFSYTPDASVNEFHYSHYQC